MISWLLGWWGFPWGPIWTIGALFKNLTGGLQPAEANGQILGRQALYFWDQNRPELAAAAIEQALRFNLSVSLRERLTELQNALPEPPTVTLINRWRVFRAWGFWAQAMPILLVFAVIGVSNHDRIVDATASETLAHASAARLSLMEKADPNSPVLATIRPYENFVVLEGLGNHGFDRVRTQSGTVGYVGASAVIAGDGAADLKGRCFPNGPVTLVNGQVLSRKDLGPHTLRAKNGLPTDSLVKLRDLSGKTILSFYVKAKSEAQIEEIPEGSYYIEFATGDDFSDRCGYFTKNMRSSRFADSDNFQTTTKNGDRYSAILEVTLNPVAGGTAKTVSTDSTVFDQD